MIKSGNEIFREKYDAKMCIDFIKSLNVLVKLYPILHDNQFFIGGDQSFYVFLLKCLKNKTTTTVYK